MAASWSASDAHLKSQALTLFDLVERLSLLTPADLWQGGSEYGFLSVRQ